MGIDYDAVTFLGTIVDLWEASKVVGNGSVEELFDKGENWSWRGQGRIQIGQASPCYDCATGDQYTWFFYVGDVQRSERWERRGRPVADYVKWETDHKDHWAEFLAAEGLQGPLMVHCVHDVY